MPTESEKDSFNSLVLVSPPSTLSTILPRGVPETKSRQGRERVLSSSAPTPPRVPETGYQFRGKGDEFPLV